MPAATSPAPSDRQVDLVDLVDMFGSRPGRGSRLAVVDDPTALDGAPQAVAAGAGADETAFVVHAQGDNFDTRVFNPVRETSQGGHSAAGVAAWLVARGRLAAGRLVQRLPSGSTTTVWSDGRAVEVELPLATPPTPSGLGPSDLAELLGAGVAEDVGLRIGPGPGFLLVGVGPDLVEAPPPDLPRLVARGLRDVTYCHHDPHRRQVVTRVFAPGHGIDVDSACAPVAAAAAAAFVERYGDRSTAPVSVRQVTDAGGDARFDVRILARGLASVATVRGRVWTNEDAGGGQLL